GGALDDEGATVSGSLQATNAAWIIVTGGATISGNLQVTGTTGAPSGAGNRIFDTDIRGNPVVSTHGRDPPLRTGNAGAAGGAAPTITAPPTGPSNAGRLQIGRSTAQGNIAVSGNTGGGILTGNRASGNCTLSGDTPPITGTSNTASGHNNCNVNA